MMPVVISVDEGQSVEDLHRVRVPRLSVESYIPKRALGDADVQNKREADLEIAHFLGQAGPAKLEFIFVENVKPSFQLLPSLFGECGPAFGHAALVFTRADGTRRVANIVGGREAAGGREMVEFWECPEDYFYGSHGKGGIFARSMCILRVQELADSSVEAVELYLGAFLASYRASRAKWHNCGSCISAWSWFRPGSSMRPTANCSDVLSRACFLAGVLRRPHTFPKAAWLDLFESFVLDCPADQPRAHVVYLRQVAERETKQRPPVWSSIVAPMRWLESFVYWDLASFADAVVTVEASGTGQRRAVISAGRRRRPRWMRHPILRNFNVMVTFALIIFVLFDSPIRSAIRTAAGLVEPTYLVFGSCNTSLLVTMFLWRLGLLFTLLLLYAMLY